MFDFDLFRKDPRGNPVWIDTVPDVDTARARANQLTAALPGDYFVFDQSSRTVVATFESVKTDEL